MTTNQNKPRTAGVTPKKCVWQGGGYQLWCLTADGQDFFRLSYSGEGWLGDFATEAEATAAMTVHSAKQ